MKKLLILLSLLVIALFVVSCAPKESAGEEGALAGEAKVLPPISKPACPYLIGLAGSFKMTKELTLEKGIFGNPTLLADEFNENELTEGCVGIYNLRSCNSLDYINEEGTPASGSPYWNWNVVEVGIVKLPVGVTETTVSDIMSNFTAITMKKKEFQIKSAAQGGKIKNVWSGDDHLIWVSGDLLIEVVGPLAKADWSLFDVYYKKYPPNN